ncbi:DUF6316 family protein [Aestuariirhabdus litorea]|uniref:DUF6316 domain-containing protein n=1 Tax=Aestuariirhabdus litorea TaxID=2528527 RepID=A0A3P3VM38_9GAMM|nr:DUF6316 family protein [Aestuariirhabdus litorea]RRJ83397.1 hypothetical protein D0544_16410 [Aestuariirhabdus litorea]RWW93558.1 hypothetical protein DZC74_16380 [Endozoicomonadaceae bacterium GTF-13]
MDYRSGEGERTWFRSERFLCMNGEWYFITREGSQEGPYRSQAEAERDLCIYIRHQNDQMLQASIKPTG